ncbi:MAG TPA: 50S ribosomal protein L29 [Waterburya sp.]|jgi:large subunit ribosomal protein L29
MPLPKIEDARNMSDQELADAILAAKRELFDLRLQQATRRLEKPHQFKHVKHRIAQMMTVIREREVAVAKSANQASATSAASASPQASTAAAESTQPEE